MDHSLCKETSDLMDTLMDATQADLERRRLVGEPSSITERGQNQDFFPDTDLRKGLRCFILPTTEESVKLALWEHDASIWAYAEGVYSYQEVELLFDIPQCPQYIMAVFVNAQLPKWSITGSRKVGYFWVDRSMFSIKKVHKRTSADDPSHV